MASLNLLLIEDSEDDAARVTDALTKAGYAVQATRVRTPDSLVDKLIGRAHDYAYAVAARAAGPDGRLSLVDARVPYDNILGSPTVEKTTSGFKGAMATFDATRPLVAASGLGVARAALEFLKEKLAENGVQIRYGLPRQKLTSIERDVM